MFTDGFTDGFTAGFTAESTAGSTAGSSHILVRAHKDPFKVADAATTLRRNLIGSNVGNLVFSQATFRLLSVPATTIDASPLEPPPAARDPTRGSTRRTTTSSSRWPTRSVRASSSS